MATDISSILNSRIRLTGMASGLDTDTIVKQLMSIEQSKVNKVKQEKQLLEWKKENYREYINLLRAFKDEFFDVLRPSSYMLSASNYKTYSVAGLDSDYLSAVASSTAVPGSHTIEIQNIATAASLKSSDTVSKPILGSVVTSLPEGNSLTMTLDGITKTITVGATVEELQSSIDSAFGAGKIMAEDTDADLGEFQLKFSTIGGATKLSLYDGTAGTLEALGFASGTNTSNRISTSDTLSTLSSTLGFTLSEGNVNLTINNKSFTFDGYTTLYSMMQQINSSSEANVNMQYDEITDKFTITAKQTGAGENLSISETGSNFLETMKLSSSNIAEGVDATVLLDGSTIKRSSNTFTVSGVTYTIYKPTVSQQTITVNQDVDTVYNRIKSFVDKYNELIGKINAETSEEYDRDYLPLTDDEKQEMSEEEIELWEEKAKTGLLRNDSLLSGITTDMRRALYDAVTDISGGLSSIGITTGTYLEKGKLIIDETKLKEAISTQPDMVMNLFSNESEISYTEAYGDSAKITQRYNENGLMNRIFDIIQNNIRTIRDSLGKKGLLLEKAGTTSDITEYNNYLQDQIDAKEKLIDELTEKLYDKEDRYYKKFAAMESAISSMNSQSNWLTQQFSSLYE